MTSDSRMMGRNFLPFVGWVKKKRKKSFILDNASINKVARSMPSKTKRNKLPEDVLRRLAWNVIKSMDTKGERPFTGHFKTLFDRFICHR